MMPIMPKAGTAAFEEFMRKARDPRSLEAGMLRRVVDDSASQTQQQVKTMLHQMIELVQGQLFRDIGRFHDKFELEPTGDPEHRLPDDVLQFRIMFMYEELQEYVDAIGGTWCCPGVNVDPSKFDVEKAFDALIDLVYVALGTAFLHRFPFNEGWDRVQAANMKKVRASGNDDPLSKRKHNKDVVKPPGWVPPVLLDLLDEKCPECKGTGEIAEQKTPVSIDFTFCGACSGTGRRRRAPAEGSAEAVDSGSK